MPSLALWAPALLLAVSEILLRPQWPGVQTLISDWANVAKYSLYLFAGALLAVDPVLEARARAQWAPALAVGTALIVLLLAAKPAGAPPLLGAVVAYGVPAVAGWCFVVSLLGIAAHIARPGPRLALLAAASMPIYVLHQVGVVVAAWWIDPLPLPIVARLILILAASVAAVLLFYVVAVRRVGWLAAALGARPARPDARRAAAAALGETAGTPGGGERIAARGRAAQLGGFDAGPRRER